MRPATISADTQSIAVEVNDLTPQVFNTTPTSPECYSVPSGTACTIAVKGIPVTTDTFVVTTYSGKNAGGLALDRAKLVYTVTDATNLLVIRLGPVVSNNADSGIGSLRYAVANSSSGDTITFITTGQITIAVQSAIAIDHDLAIAGPGVQNVTISGGNANGLFAISSGVKAAISGLTLSDGRAPEGGAISNGGNLTVDSDVFNDNTSFNNTARTRGIPPRPHAELSAGTHVRSKHGKHEHVRAARAPRVRVDRMPSAVTPAGNGGAINSSGQVQGSLTVINSTFTNNVAAFNAYDEEGGAIWSQSGFKLVVRNSRFSGNQASYGAAVEVDGPSTFVNDTFDSNHGYPGDTQNDPFGAGAGIHPDGPSVIDRCTFTNNLGGGKKTGSSGYGAAISSDASAAVVVTNSSFTGNTTGGGSSGGSYGLGGAIFASDTTRLTLENDSFVKNVAGGDSSNTSSEGGAVYSNLLLKGKSDTFDGNVAYATSASSGTAAGGGVFAEGGLTLSDSTFTANKATGGYKSHGGGLFSDDVATLNNVQFSKNVSSAVYDTYGGGFASYGGTFTGVTASQNAATGGQYAYGAGGDTESPATFIGSTFDSNTASATGDGQGGGLYVDDTLTFNGNVTNNAASSAGGGLFFFYQGSIVDSTISGNSVTALNGTENGGGGIYIEDETLTIAASTLSGNSAGGSTYANAGGGGIYNDYGSILIYNSTISNNSTTLDGGGIYNYDATIMTLLNATLYENSASGNGGNVITSGPLTLQNTILAGGTAASGKDAYSTATMTSSNYNLIETSVAGGGTFTPGAQDLYPAGVGAAKLLALANNGGPTKTNADQTTSPGYDYIPLSVCTGANPSITKDQRGKQRGDNGDNRCDIGAYENQTAP